MRIAHSVLTAFLVVSGIPSVCFGQIVIPYRPHEAVDRLDNPVPVATVTYPEDLIALAHPQPGDGFVLGAATLNLADRNHPVIAFTMTNAYPAPMPFSAINLVVYTVNVQPDSGDVVASCKTGFGRLSYWLPKSAVALRPGETVSVELPIGPQCAADAGPARGFLVSIRHDTFSPDASPALPWDAATPQQVSQQSRDEAARMVRAFEQLRSQPHQ